MMNGYKNTSFLYDLDEREIVKDDISFYLEYASQSDGEVLEIACGTGRVTIPLAQAGYHVTGIDLSSPMIDRLRSKLAIEQGDVRDRVSLLEADMTSFELNKHFPLVIIPFRSFQLLSEQGQPEKCLQRIAAHLTADGIVIITAYRPYAVLDESWVQPECEDWIREDLATGNKIRRTNIKRHIDLINQITYPELIYYVQDSAGVEQIYTDKLAMKYYYEIQLRELLIDNGFKVVSEFGYYDRRPMNEGTELIFVCKKSL